MKEYWRTIPGYDNYEAEAYTGKIRNKNFRGTGKPRELKPFYRNPNRDNYLAVNLRVDGKKCPTTQVHRLIVLTFPEICGELFEGAVVNHKDENQENNSAFNLETCTVAFNNSWGTRIDRVFETNVENGRYGGFHCGTPEYKEYVNKKARDKRANETEEEKAKRRQENNEKARIKRQNETPEEKSNRREKARERYHKQHPNSRYNRIVR